MRSVVSKILILVLVIIFTGCGSVKQQSSENNEKTMAASSSPASSSEIINAKIKMQEVERHGVENDCYLIIRNKAYDVTTYLNKHPTGKTGIVELCGKDATSAFDSKSGSGKSHSERANIILDKYFIGELEI